MEGIDDQDMRQAELSYCLKNSLNFVDTQGLEEAKKGNGDEEGSSEADKEEEKPDEWLVDVRYASRLLKKANDLRIKKRLCDVTIGLKDGKLEVHKSMLAAGSPFFKHLTETTRASTLNFFHMSTCVADILFDFMYTGEVNQDKVNKLSRSERKQLREKADLFEIGQQMQPLWQQLGLDADTTSKNNPQKEHHEQSDLVATASEIVKRKVLYMNERRKQGDFADWKIRISAVDIPVSKVFLAASSTYFADFFARNPSEAKSETYTLTELNRRTFRKVLNFIYTGHVITEGRELPEIKDLLFQASYLGIGDLSNRLVEEVESRLNADNCFAIFAYANSINCRQLFKSVSRYVGRLGAKSAVNAGFLGLEFNDLRAALLNSDLRFDCPECNNGDAADACLPWPGHFERRTLDLLIAWIRVDRIRRSSHVTDLFELVDRLGKPPYTGRREEMHKRLPSELNNVMSAYYSKMMLEAQRGGQSSTSQPETKQSAVKARRYLLPTQLLMSREFPLSGPQLPNAALKPEKLQLSSETDEISSLSSCWQLSPTEWQLQSVQVQASDPALTRLSGLQLTYRRYPLFSDDAALQETRIVSCGFRGAFKKDVDLEPTERVTQLGLVTAAVTGGTGRCTLIDWVTTCAGRRLQVAEMPTECTADGNESCQRSIDSGIVSIVKSPEASRGFLHGFGLRFSEAMDNGALTVVWAVEADVDGLGESPWSSVIENE